jgi:signal transduction histidine kinase
MHEFFKISSGLKTLIGSELITDNHVAVFELVKNSFDAGAKEVKIIFENLYHSDGKIIIADNGKGMDYDDLLNKWLFVAYSAKKDGSEDDVKNDYRDKIDTNKYYAGAKGIGRFSCDRLGKKLNLITIKDEEDAKIENIKIDWTKFEEDQKEEFINIPVEHHELKNIPYKIRHGTILEISEINKEDWNRDSLIKLKEKLSKLVRPDLNKSIDEKPFRILFEVPEEKSNDIDIIERGKKNKEEDGYFYYNTVNGEIKNFIFEELGIKTTRIISNISSDGSVITSRLEDRGIFLYEIKERNEFELLKDLSINLYFLNRSAKNTFKRRMGVDHVDYGSIFIYKNGFRIYPYGERGDDSLGIENRALQGYARYIGLRSLIGQIEIDGDNKELKETTSRDGGLVKTKAYNQLANTDDGYLITILRRLEKYVVDITNWGVNEDDFKSMPENSYQENLVRFISNITNDKNVIALEYNKKIIDIVQTQEEKSARKLIRNFKRIATESEDKGLLRDAQKLETTLETALQAKESAEKERLEAIKGKKGIEEELEQQIGETLFARSVLGTETKELLSVQHHIYRHSAQHISLFVDKLIDAINANAPKQKLLDLAAQIAFENKKIITVSQFILKAAFNTNVTKINADLIKFVNEYVINVYQEYKHLAINNQNLKIITATPKGLEFQMSFKPLEIIIILDNLLNNSFKAKAKNVKLVWESKNKSEIELHVIDDGIGLAEKNLNRVFDFRFTTTNGSGLGLYHTKQIIESMKGSILANNKIDKGAEFILHFKK